MSHNIKLSNVRFTDLGMLERAIQTLAGGQATLDRNAKTFRTYRGQPNKCDAAIKMPGAHDIGLLRQPDGAFNPIFDPYAMSEIFKVPQGTNYIGALAREYALMTAEYEAAQNGMVTERIENKATGTVTLEIVQAA